MSGLRVLVISDLHLEVGCPPVRLNIQPDAVDIVLLAGDIDEGRRGLAWAASLARCGVPVVYVAGNHEYWGHSLKLADKLRNQAHRLQRDGLPLYFLECDATIVETAKGPVRVLGATGWSDFTLFGERLQINSMAEALTKMPDYMHIRRGFWPWQRLRPEDTLKICEETMRWIWEVVIHPFDGPTLIVTHTAPSFKSIHADYSDHVLTPVFASDFEEVLKFGHVCLWAHGHVHHSVDYWVGKTRIVCNPRGYWPKDINSTFDPKLIVTI
jgi:Icc-related predicted phosphoesterase